MNMKESTTLELAWRCWGTTLDVRHMALERGVVPMAGGLPTFRVEDGSWSVEMGQGWEAVLDGATGSSPWSGDGRLPAGRRLRLRQGDQELIARTVLPGSPLPRSAAQPDLGFLGALSLAASAALALVALSVFTAPAPEDQVFELPERLVMALQQAPPPLPSFLQPRQAPKPQDAGKTKAGETGRRGTRQALLREATGVRLRPRDAAVVQDAGLIGVLAEAGATSGIFGDEAIELALRGVGDLRGSTAGTRLGTEAWGRVGEGVGAGGTEVGTIDSVDTRGRDDGYGRDGAEHGDYREGTPVSVDVGPILVMGMDRSLIDAVIKSHMNQIRHCYQRQLQRDPSLGGKVTVAFVIAGSGQVASDKVKRSSMEDAAVHSCLVRTFHRMQFPEVKGGGIVQVSYPLIFEAM